MTASARRSHSWDALVVDVGDWLASLALGVFDIPRIVTASRAAGRLLSQVLAQGNPARITAGIEFVTLNQWSQVLRDEHGMAGQWAEWKPDRLQFHVRHGLERLTGSGKHPVLERYLHSGSSDPELRLMDKAQQVARLLVEYLHHSPTTVERWLQGDDVDCLGDPVPEWQAWQPELLRDVAAATSDPIILHQRLLGRIEGTTNSPLAFVGVTDVAALHEDLLLAHATQSPVMLWSLDGSIDSSSLGEPRALADQVPASTTAPTVTIHASHGRLRQVEVLRDELTRLFQEDHELEPRDVVIVAQDPQRWLPLLRSVFSPTALPDSHPGRSLRVEIPRTAVDNVVVDALLQVLALPTSRATSVEVVRLLGTPPITHRWRLDPTTVTELVSAAEIRWGLDEKQRRDHHLAPITQGTWTRGIDRLLAGLAVGSGENGLPIAGVEAVSGTDANTVGALGEILSRIRKFLWLAETPADVGEWVQRSTGLIRDLFSLPWPDAWMISTALSDLTSLPPDTRPLSREQFRRVLQGLWSNRPARTIVGNGGLHIVAPGEVFPASHKIVCFLGLSDSAPGPRPDELPMNLPDRRRNAMARIVAQTVGARQVLLVHQAFTAANLGLARPSCIDRLVHRLGVEPALIAHPPSSRDPSNFSGSRRSFDQLAARAGSVTASTEASDDVAARRTFAANLSTAPTTAGILQPDDIARFLKDPARAFLRSRANLRLFDQPGLSTELPVRITGLGGWQVREALLRDVMAGHSRHDAMRAQIMTEALPPGRLGWAQLGQLADEVGDLWALARDSWQAPVTDVSLESAHVNGRVRLRGGRVVRVVTSSSRSPWVEAWTTLVCLAASGIETEARIFQLARNSPPVRTSLRSPSRSDAEELLRVMVHGTIAGQSRLIPLPDEPALDLARSLIRNRPIDHQAWAVPPDAWGYKKWGFRSREWSIFFDGPALELFDVPVHADDSSLGNATSAFEVWSRAVYVPLLRHIQSGGA